MVVDPVIPPGFNVQFPDGNPLKTTLPVAKAQVGCVIVPTVGAAIVLILITTVSVIFAIQEAGLIAVKVKVTAPVALALMV